MRDRLLEAAAAARAEAVEGVPFSDLDAATQETHRVAATIELKLYAGVFKTLGLIIAPRALPDDIAHAVSEDITVQADGQEMRLATGTVQDYWAGCVAQLDKE